MAQAAALNKQKMSGRILFSGQRPDDHGASSRFRLLALRARAFARVAFYPQYCRNGKIRHVPLRKS
jgi:hypothetical protein